MIELGPMSPSLVTKKEIVQEVNKVEMVQEVNRVGICSSGG